MSDASEMLAAALEQMDGIIAGSKAMDYSNGLFDCQSPTSPFLGGLRALHLLEDLRGALELMDNEERDNLRCQIPDSTAEGLAEWLQGRMTNGHGSSGADAVYQERLSRLESDKECLILQVSVLTDQVEVQGEKIRDLDTCLEEHREKLNATEELLQQELLNRTALETQKLELMTEVSSLKLKLTSLMGNGLFFLPPQGLYQEVTDLRFRVTDIENERLLCEKKLKATKVTCGLIHQTGNYTTEQSTKVQFCLKILGTILYLQEQRIEELQESLTKYKKVQERVKGETITDHTQILTNNKAGTSSSSLTKASTTGDESFGTKKARSSFGRGFFKIRGSKRTSSAPNLDRSRSASAPTLGTVEQNVLARPAVCDDFQFCRLKRSHSTSFNLDEPSEMEFRRGGVRATAGPRLGWSRDLKHGASSIDVPFSRWSKDQVCAWLQEQGLGLYVAQGQNWIQSGQTLLQASHHDLEKELGIKHPLHRKKLQLALQALGLKEEDDLKGKLDHNWVTRWLDDIGLPQYKSQFDDGRVDGRMLHCMTVDDLLSLKVGSVLHHLSIKRAIQVLRLNSYDPNCLRRRPSDENNITPAEISQWTNHRVMEWLRSVDLAEYAPNLRGSGVHGGLMVLEPRFNVESLALLLNIPPNKTLLRRHLATHFHLLIGSEAQRLKQECLENPDYTVLTATAKVKPRRLSFGGFGTLRRKRQEDSEEYVCPMNVEMPKSSSFQKGYRIYEDSLDQLEQMEDSEGTVRQIGAFSEGIKNLTSMLTDDEFFSEISYCPPEVDVADDNSNV
uniref:PPFIA binding protein 1a n=1 Tax=Myripristis murdjan TaxID=586833 RepID=A0A668A0B1_9TELE